VKKEIAIFFLVSSLMVFGACYREFDPENALRIEYENPLGCDEVSGIITLKASVKGDGAPLPAAMRYELRTREDGEPVVVTGNAPAYAADFDTTTIRDGLVYYKAVPLDSSGNEIDIQSLRYRAQVRPPEYRGIMINNRTIDLSKPLIVFGAETEPYVGDLTGTWTADQLMPHLTFAATLMEHLRELSYIPEMCFADNTTIVMDSSDPLAEGVLVSDNLVDMLGEPVTGVPHWNNGTACLPTPFFEIRRPNGIPDAWENTALDNVKAYTQYGSVKSEPESFALYAEIGDRLTAGYSAVFDNQSYFGFKKPVRNADPENLLKEKLRSAISAGATGVLIYDFYVKTNDFEMSVGSWPQYQKTVDELNEELNTSVRVGAITTNDSQLMLYDNFLRSLYLGVRDTIKTSKIPSDKKLGIIIVEHGISKSGRLYDALRISTQVLNERLTNYFTARMGALHDTGANLNISYIEGTYPPGNSVPEVGEQVAAWVKDGYEYIVIYPAEWFWESRQTYQDLRQFAVEEIDENNTDIYTRDARERTEITINSTRLIISETTLSKKTSCPAAYHYLKTAAAQLLEERLIAMTKAQTSEALSGTVSISGGNINLSLAFHDTLLAHDGNISLQNAGIRGQGTTTQGTVTGTIDTSDMEYYLFALLADNGVDAEDVTVSEALIDLTKTDTVYHGSIHAKAAVEINGENVLLTIKIEL